MTYRLISTCLTVLPLLAACGGVRLQTKEKAIDNVSRSTRHDAERQCDQYMGEQRPECWRKVREYYESLRRKNAEGGS